MNSKESQRGISRRTLLKLGVSGGAVALIGILNCSRESGSNLDPDTAGRPFAQAVLNGDYNTVINHLSPDRRTMYDDPRQREELEKNIRRFAQCQGVKLKESLFREDPPIVTFLFDKQCQIISYSGAPTMTQKILVRLERVNNRYYPVTFAW